MLLCVWSINEQLQGRPGCEVPRPTTEYLSDVVAIAVAEREDLETAQREAERKARFR